MKFIECSRVRDYHISKGEKCAILREVREEYPCVHAEIVEGGAMIFDTWDEFYTWSEQN